MTNTNIEDLETAAGKAGDIVQAAICQIALYGAPDEATQQALSPAQRVDLHQRFGDFHSGADWRRLAAEQECLRIIDEGA